MIVPGNTYMFGKEYINTNISNYRSFIGTPIIRYVFISQLFAKLQCLWMGPKAKSQTDGAEGFSPQQELEKDREAGYFLFLNIFKTHLFSFMCTKHCVLYLVQDPFTTFVILKHQEEVSLPTCVKYYFL